MRHLLQPRVLNDAALAAAVSALACYPCFLLWLKRPGGLVYLETTIFVCTMMLWGFVFAWHMPYTGRRVFMKPDSRSFTIVTAWGVGVALPYALWLDPQLRSKLPEEYPADLAHWFGAALFALAVGQLFQVFAPYDWFLRLVPRHRAALIFTALFGVAVQAMKLHLLGVHLTPALNIGLLLMRLLGGFLAVTFYLRGGVLLVGWWTLLLEARHLIWIG